tara:strand:- start:164 stop:421 length:258 start_codon:yes stop_codon:yes gene_type:complete
MLVTLGYNKLISYFYKNYNMENNCRICGNLVFDKMAICNSCIEELTAKKKTDLKKKKEIIKKEYYFKFKHAISFKKVPWIYQNDC